MIDISVWQAVTVAALFGLLLGSFFNVVIHRLPKMMEQHWDAECAEHMAVKSGNSYEPQPATLTLSKPRSRCPHCGHQIRWFENIPVISWLCLRGQCASCRHRISIRYPLIELATAALFAWCVYRWGITPSGLAWCAFSSALLVLAMIDWDTTYLPDSITLPLIWAGLLAASFGWLQQPLSHSLWGAAIGYLSLWSIYWGFKLLTGKEGMGFGDFKLFAALGAWFGWQALLPIILMASVIGALIGIAMKFTSGLREGGYIPFGPFLAGAGFMALFFGAETIMQTLFAVAL